MLWIWTQFGICALLIGIAGVYVSRYGDVIAEKTGASRGLIGLVLMATVTSLPELVTGVSSVTAAGTPDIALGDVAIVAFTSVSTTTSGSLLSNADSNSTVASAVRYRSLASSWVRWHSSSR